MAKKYPADYRLEMVTRVLVGQVEYGSVAKSLTAIHKLAVERAASEEGPLEAPSRATLHTWVSYEQDNPGATEAMVQAEKKAASERVPGIKAVKPKKTVKVTTLGLRYKWENPDDGPHAKPTLWEPPQELLRQLRLVWELNCELNRTEYDLEKEIESIYNSFPEVEALTKRLNGIEKKYEELQAKKRGERSRLRTSKLRPDHPLILEAQALNAERLLVRQELAVEKAVIKGDADPRIKLAMKFRDDRQAALYPHCRALGMYYDTINDVRKHHRIAYDQVLKTRKKGQSAQLRIRPFDGTGTLTVQLKRQAGKGPRTPATIRDRTTPKWSNQFWMPWVDPTIWDSLSAAQRRQYGRVTVTMRIGDDPSGAAVYIKLPLQQHRMLPADADIALARLTVSKVADGYRVKLSATAIMAPPEPIETGPMVALHLGWTDSDDGTVVAYWRSTEPLVVPERLAHVMRADAGSLTGTVVLPHYYGDRLARVDELHSQRDVMLNEVREQLVAWLQEHGPIPHPVRGGLQLTGANVAKWRSPAAFADIADKWAEEVPDGGTEIAVILAQWKRYDFKLRREQENTRENTLASRDDLYKNVAAVIATQAMTLVIDDTTISKFAAKDEEGEDLPVEIATMLRHRRTVAAPTYLREFSKTAMVREGGTVTEVQSVNLSLEHAACGHVNTTAGTCERCTPQEYDTNQSATMLMIRRAQPAAPVELVPV